MKIYCARCKKHTNNAYKKKLVMLTNKKLKGKSRRVDCMAIRSLFDKIKDKDEVEVVVSQCLIDFL